MVKDQLLIKKRREQMIKAAVTLFIQKGFHRTTTREIAKESGFSIGTLYEYIGSKEDILYLVCDSIYDQVSENLKKRLKQDVEGIDSLRYAIAALFRVIDDLQDEVLVMYQESKSLPKEALRYVLQKEFEMTELIQEVIQECVTKGHLELTDQEIYQSAHNILVQAHMWTFRRWAIQNKYTLDEYTEIQTNLFLNGLLKK
ncbi:TetR/AcrR family transcriptional regulator [Anaerobacillus alkaliphilus]|uniref:TetR/AcrR family transcriptional regulator n=1 Tax=Anaerobacillus alkaliphilus TaxID=1548597 RepID=A0A4Q0VVG7_9BACI|nr:TetR/AcrR family transcriptional regulator [Anaerobacillus alkaliphilus]RXJ02856.1 TetR/AcrR family transcriptional regulator [Anaerobacillus alkaliphilus]